MGALSPDRRPLTGGPARLVSSTWRCDVGLEQLPEVMTVEEAAAFLRIGRSAAYELCRQWRATGGRAGLPVLTLGRTLRVPRAGIARMLLAPEVGAGPAPQDLPDLGRAS